MAIVAPFCPQISCVPPQADPSCTARVDGWSVALRYSLGVREGSMQRQWYLIDDDGIHPLMGDDDTRDFWQHFNRGDDDAPWPPFNQVVVQASPTRVVEALARTGPALGLRLREVTDDPAQWPEALVVADADGVTVVGEPGVDIDDAALAMPWAEALMAELRCDGALFGYDDAAKTLHLSRFKEGTYDFAWADSLLPGPSYAMVFDDDGQCVESDPRRFALQMLDMPETSPLLDRYQFVHAILAELGLETIEPQLLDLPVSAVLATEVATAPEHGSSG